jgi:outer membrane receptor protein involved in Fe transport
MNEGSMSRSKCNAWTAGITAALLALTFLLTSFSSQAQTFGTIGGVVKDQNGVLEFANVFLTTPGDTSKIISATVTDSLGQFTLINVSNGAYFLNVRFLGFKNKAVPVSVIQGKSVDIGTVDLAADPHVLQTVEVQALRNIIEKTDEGFVVNASSNVTQIGGTAADLLKNMPGVLVSAEGEITLRGKTPLTLINGRISGITGVDRTAQLERIPASNIERIEIINNPSAKYDADAEGGVINIVLKKNEDKGTNGAFAVGAGLGDRYRLNASFLVNHKTEKLNLGIAYDNWYTTRTRRVKGDRINYDLPNEYFLTQRRFDERLIFYQNTKADIDYSINKKNSLNFEALWAFPGEDNNETLRNTYETSTRDFTSKNSRHSNEIRRSHAVDFSLLYVRTFDKPEKVLKANVSSTFSNDKENTDITTQRLTEQEQNVGNESLQRTHIYQKTNLTNVAVDYSDRLGRKGTLEAGYKSIFRMLNADFERANFTSSEFVIDPLNTNIFDFNEQIHAVYGQYIGWTGEKETPKWKYSIGLRAEQVWNDGATESESAEFKNDYFNIFPSTSLFYYTKDQNNFKLSYSRRINRPGLGQLNPFTDITDSLNQRAGNPRLKPELIHSMELAYYQSWQKASLSIVSFYRLRNNAILPYTILDENGVAFTQPLNFGKAYTLGAEAIATLNVYSAWAVNFSISAYEFNIDDEGSVANIATNQINWYTKLINNFSLFKGGKLQIIGNYTSPVTIPQGESVAVYFVDIGFQQRIMKGKGRLGLTATDIFNTQEYGFITSDYNFDFSRVFKLDTRAIMLTFGYTFGTSFKENLMENRFKND